MGLSTYINGSGEIERKSETFEDLNHFVSSVIPAHQNFIDSSWTIHNFFFLSSHCKESKLSNSGWRGQYFDIQLSEIDKVRKKVCWNHL